VARSAAALLVTALVVAAADLIHKAVALADPGSLVVLHPRSVPYAVGVVAVSALWAAAILLTRSTSIALAGGVFLGGAAGNVASLALWPSVAGVPNPLIAGDIAFNLADLAVALGLALVLVSAIVFTVRNRAHLGEPVRLGRSL
jgi:lipoprotein signal peptidase